MSPLDQSSEARLDSAGTCPLISVVIPNYNYGRYLPQAIDSALAQSYPNVEVIVVDDGSTDGSDLVRQRYGDRVRWFGQQNQGVSVARNRGIGESRGSLVAFLDSDDTWQSEKLERQVEKFQNPAVGMVYTGLQIVSESGQLLDTVLCGGRGWLLRELALMPGPTVPATGSSALVRRECFDQTGLFDPALSTSADWDMWRRIACYYEIEVVREPLVLYRQHQCAMHRNVELLERDMLHAFSRMFTDPAAEEIRPLQRQCYGKLYMMLCGSFLYAGNWKKSLRYLVRSLIAWPPGISYPTLLPVRHLRRYLRKQVNVMNLVR